MLVAVVMLVASVFLVDASVASAAPPRVSGSVLLDTDADGVADGLSTTGLDEPGLGGVTIEIVCDGGTVLASTTSAVDGTFAIEDVDESLCPSGQVSVRSTVTDDRYSITDGAGVDNDTPRTADPQVGQSTPFTLDALTDQTINSLVRPDWYLDLTIPVDGGLGMGH